MGVISSTVELMSFRTIDAAPLNQYRMIVNKIPAKCKPSQDRRIFQYRRAVDNLKKTIFLRHWQSGIPNHGQTLAIKT